MMDFGFGAFLERFELYFGATVTSCLLALIGLTVAVTCSSLIITHGIVPVSSLITEVMGTGLKDKPLLEKVISGATSGIAFVGGGILAFYLLRPWFKKKVDALSYEADQTISTAKELLGNIHKEYDELVVFMGEVETAAEEAKAILAEAKTSAPERQSLPDIG